MELTDIGTVFVTHILSVFELQVTHFRYVGVVSVSARNSDFILRSFTDNLQKLRIGSFTSLDYRKDINFS